MFTLTSSLRVSSIDAPCQAPWRSSPPTVSGIGESSGANALTAESELFDPWDRALSSPFFATWIGRCVIVAWSVVGAALFGFATGAILGTVAGGWVSPVTRDPSMLTEEVLLMALIGALTGAVRGGQGSDSRTSCGRAVELPGLLAR